MTQGPVHLLEIAGDAGLRAAQETATLLREALAAHDSVSVATHAMTGADITTIQLLIAARKQAEASGKTLSLAAPPAGAFRDLLVATGCLSADGRPMTLDGAFWAPEIHKDKGVAA
ncbi:MAG: STAS domain-containing protein [Alphaproteobacteria bacterium]|nr:STAS domain-containing protein [Alphaproteobacteria bacterium]